MSFIIMSDILNKIFNNKNYDSEYDSDSDSDTMSDDETPYNSDSDADLMSVDSEEEEVIIIAEPAGESLPVRIDWELLEDTDKKI